MHNYFYVGEVILDRFSPNKTEAVAYPSVTGEVRMRLVVQLVPFFVRRHVKHQGKIGKDHPNAGRHPRAWPSSVCPNIHMIWNAFTSWYTVCVIQVYIPCTGVNYSSISMVTEGSTSSTGMRENTFQRANSCYSFHWFGCKVNGVYHVTTRW